MRSVARSAMTSCFGVGSNMYRLASRTGHLAQKPIMQLDISTRLSTIRGYIRLLRRATLEGRRVILALNVKKYLDAARDLEDISYG